MAPLYRDTEALSRIIPLFNIITIIIHICSLPLPLPLFFFRILSFLPVVLALIFHARYASVTRRRERLPNVSRQFTWKRISVFGRYSCNSALKVPRTYRFAFICDNDGDHDDGSSGEHGTNHVNGVRKKGDRVRKREGRATGSRILPVYLASRYAVVIVITVK